MKVEIKLIKNLKLIGELSLSIINQTRNEKGEVWERAVTINKIARETYNALLSKEDNRNDHL